MILRALRRSRRNQRGFTLIELLVVITVLGVLAAIVSVSLVGITSTARDTARKAEFQNVQSALDVMMTDQHVERNKLGAGCKIPTTAPNVGQLAGLPPATWTDDMTAFPSAAIYVAPDPIKGGQVTALATFYLREKTTAYQYACDANGNIYQKTASGQFFLSAK